LVTCPKGPLITDNVSGEILCGSCGIVLIEKGEDFGPESMGSDMAEYLTKSRTGPALSLAVHDKGLSTVIGTENKDATGNALSRNMKNTFNRLRIWDSYSKSRSTNRSLMRSFTLLDAMRTKLAIPDIVIEEAAYLFRKAVNGKLTRGRSTTSLLSASLYAACRELDTPRSLNDIAEASNITRKDLSRSYFILTKKLDLKLRSFDSSKFVSRISNEVGISEKTRRYALNILSKAIEKEISAGKNPMGLAAAVIYLSCVINNEKKTQTEIAKAAGVTSVTIRNRIDSLRKDLDNVEIG